MCLPKHYFNAVHYGGVVHFSLEYSICCKHLRSEVHIPMQSEPLCAGTQLCKRDRCVGNCANHCEACQTK